jgi:hypothetical protein
MTYTQTNQSPTEFTRTFIETVDDSELVWHRDKNTRNIKVLEGHDWYFQFDNELPFQLKPNIEFTIPQMKYHRIIKGSDQLVVSIQELV